MRTLGWISFFVLMTATFIDRTHFLDRAVEEILRTRLGALGADIEIEDVDIRWLDRALVVHGLRADLDRDEVHFTRAEIRVGWRGGPNITRAEVRGGQVTLSRALLTALEGGRETAAGTRNLPAADQVPTIVVRDLDVALETPEYGDIQLGRFGLALRPSAAGRPRLFGRWVPTISGVRDDAGVVWISGEMSSEGVIEARGAARALRLRATDLPAGDPFDQLRPFAPECLVEFEGRGRFDPRASLLPELELRLRVADGEVRLPYIEAPAARPVRDLSMRASAHFRPGRPAELWSRDAWDLAARIDARWEGTPLSAAIRSGRHAPTGSLAEAWINAGDMPLGAQLIELAASAKLITDLDDSLGLEGRADVSMGMRLPVDWEPGQNPGTPQEVAVLVRPSGAASIAYRGYPNPLTKRRDQGFPLRIRRVTGTVTWAHRPGTEYPIQLGLHALTGYHAGGPVDVHGSLHEFPLWQVSRDEEERRSYKSFFPQLFHLRVDSDGLPVDADLEAAFDGLASVEGIDRIFDDWNPSSGSLGLGLELWAVPGREQLALDLALDVQNVDFAWHVLPVPLDDVRGRLTVQSDGQGEGSTRTVISVACVADADAARGPLRVEGRALTEGFDRAQSAFRVLAPEVNPRNTELRDVLRRKQPAVDAILDETRIAGFVDLEVTTSEPATGRGSETWIVTRTRPGGARLHPRSFALETRAVEGTLGLAIGPISRTEGGPPSADAVVDVRGTAHVQGQWRLDGMGEPVLLGGTLAVEPERQPVLSVAGAGLNIANRGVLGSIEELMRRKGTPSDPLDPERIDIGGSFDFSTRFELPDEERGLPLRSELEVEARLDHLGFAGRRWLSDVSAHLRFVEDTGEWIGERVAAQLGSTPVSLGDIRYTPVGSGSRVTALLAAEGLPLDREHLELFVDDETLDRLLADLDLAGQVDLVDSTLVVEQRPDGVTSVSLDGSVVVDDVAVTLGLPLELRRAEAVDVSLRLEGDAMRAHASVAGLDGQLAGRRLDGTSFEMTYAEPRVSFHALQSGFEEGRLASIDGPNARFFAMDLVPPFPFELAARMDDVDVGKFLQGSLNSDFANEGLMDLDLRVAGDLDHLTGLSGKGSVNVEESRLWAIPAFQALFERLGFPTTAIFRQMRADFRIEEGALLIDRMRADSDLLSVVGSGAIDFEGQLSTDLEVRYGLVDRLGPFTRLLYAIQNSLLRVAVRGTMERPAVVLRGLFSQLFFAPARSGDRLPLPGFSDLPARF